MSISSVSNAGLVDYTAARNKILDRMSKALDQDHDGSITKDEFTKGSEAMKAKQAGSSGAPSPPDTDTAFSSADADGSGAISKDELAAMIDWMPPPQSKGPSGAQGPGGPAGPGGPGGAHKGGHKDSGDEVSGSGSTSTDPADTDDDGKVSSKEQQAYYVKQALSAYKAGATESRSG